MLFSVANWEASGERVVGAGEGWSRPGEDAARGEGPDQGGNLKVPPVDCDGRTGVANEGLLGGFLLVKGLLRGRNRALSIGVPLGEFSRYDGVGGRGEGGVVEGGDGNGANRGFHTGHEGDLNNVQTFKQKPVKTF